MKIAEVVAAVKPLNETASAEEQLGLWKLVSDSVWQAIATQAEQERRANAEKAERSKSKRGKRSGGRAASPKPIALKAVSTPPKPAQPTAANANKPIAGSPQQAQQQVQTQVPYGSTYVQPRAPIAPIPAVAGSVATQPTQQALPKQPKAKITARAGGLTV